MEENTFKDFKIEGAAIFALPEDERKAVIVDKPRYEKVPDLKDPNKTIEKLIMRVEVSSLGIGDYYPNKTSAQNIAGKLGTDLNKWVGATIIWGMITDQLIGGKQKKVLYVTDVKK